MAGGVDASIYGNVAQPDALGGIKNMLGIQNQVINNKLLQNQLLGKVAGSKALLDATNPDGSIDMPKLLQNLQNDPNGALAAPETLPNANTIQSGNITNTQNRQNLSTSSVQQAGAILGSYLQKNPTTVSREA